MKEISLKGLKKLNQDNGYFFFSRDTLNFFNTVLPKEGYLNEAEDTVYFYTSDKYPHEKKRHYRVWAGNMTDGNVTSVIDTLYQNDYEAIELCEELAETC